MAAAAKNVRGRPRTLDLSPAFRLLFPELSRRGLEDRHYALQALKILGVLPAEGSVAQPQKARYFCPGDKGNHWRWSLLAALGRIQHPDTICIFAARLVELNPDVKRSIVLVKEWRKRRDEALAWAFADDAVLPIRTIEKLAHDAAVKACGASVQTHRRRESARRSASI